MSTKMLCLKGLMAFAPLAVPDTGFCCGSSLASAL